MATRIYKNGQSKNVDDKRVSRFLEQGWTTDPAPKLSVSVEATADIKKEPKVEVQETSESAEEFFEFDDDDDNNEKGEM